MRCNACSNVIDVQRGRPTASATVPLPAPAVPLPMPARSAAKPVPDASREWKIRQPGGNLFTFKELTTLQKWIVERKVNRDDEISLNGETWRKLGAIGELSVFFQVVDEAQRAVQLTPGPRRTPMPQPAPLIASPPPQAAPPQAAPPPLAIPLPSPVVPIPAAAPPPLRMDEGLRGIGQMPLQPPEPSFSNFSPALSQPLPGADFDEFDSLRQSSRAGRNLALGMLGLVGVLGAVYLYQRYEDDSVSRVRHPPQAEVADRVPPAKTPKEVPQPEAVRPTAEPSKAPAAPVLAKPVEPAARPDALASLPPPVPEAPVAAPAAVPAAPPTVPAPAPPMSFEAMVRRADKLREQEKPEEALELYGKAADLRPNRAEALAGKGLALFDMGQKLPAEAAFKRALELNPQSGTALIGLAETYRSMSRTEEAIAYYEKYLNTLPDGPEAGVARSSIRRLKEP